MNSPWLYLHLGTIAQIAGLGALAIIGILALQRKRKSKKLANKNSGSRPDLHRH